MSALHEAKKTGALEAFINRLGMKGLGGIAVLDNPTEELLDDIARGKSSKLYGMSAATRPFRSQVLGQQQQVAGRYEDNYLFSTRRFPANITNNTIGSGAIVAGDYDYFGNGVGDVGSSMGYFSLGNLTYLQTNMAKGGLVPNGRGFEFIQMGVSFNAKAAGSDIAQCLDTMSLKFIKNDQYTVYHGPIRNWPGGTGLTGYAATTASTTTIQGGANGVPDMRAARSFSKAPRVISANETFKYVITAAANLPNSNTAVALSDFIEASIWVWGRISDKIVG